MKLRSSVAMERTFSRPRAWYALVESPNRCALSFHPQSPHASLHIISVRLPTYPDLQITARRAYWA
jgi:hypothetical protein